MTIHSTVKIHPTAVLEGDISIAEGTEIGALCYIKGPATIGKNNKILPHTVIGCDGEHKTAAPQGRIIIGDNNRISELVVIQRGTGDRDTQIGNNCYIMDHCHIAHDVLIQDDVTLSPNVVLGGHTIIMQGATVGIATITHQLSTIGSYSMIGMGSVVTKDIPPLCLVMGNPAHLQRFNTHVFKKLGIAEPDVEMHLGESPCLTTTSTIVKELYNDFNALSRRKKIITLKE